jgi:uncharacterized membrane protein
MMSQIETVVEIQRPFEQVFAYLADLRNMTAWAEGIVEVEATAPEATGPGAAYRLVALLAGRRVTTPITITQYESGRMYASVTKLGPLIFHDHWEFTPSGDGTRVRQVSDMHAAGLLAPLGWLAARLLGTRLAEDLRRAKRLLEAANPTA